MQLNHLDLQTPDVPATAEFFERHFGFRILGNRASPAIIVLAGDGGLTLVIQRRGDGERYPDGFHVGFIVDEEAAVREVHARLVAAGVPCGGISENRRGVMFYLRAPGDVVVEVSCRAGRSIGATDGTTAK